MLQHRKKERFHFYLVCFVAIVILQGCASGTSTNTSEESSYLADYVTPVNKWGFIDTTGQLVIDPAYDDVGPFSEGYAAVNQNGRWGYIDRKGQVVINPQFKSAWAFHQGRARVKPFDQPEQFISPSGKRIASPEWNASADFSEGRAKVSIGNSFGYIDTMGILIIPAIYQRGWNFREGLAVIGYEDKLGVIDIHGGIVLPAVFDQVKVLGPENLVLCNRADTSIAYDLHGKELARLPNAGMTESNGLIISVRKQDSMYFFDLAAKEFIKRPAWSDVICLGDNRWAGKNGHGYFLLGARGEILSHKSYGQINRFVNGIAACYTNTSWGYIDLNGSALTIDVLGLAWDYKEGFARAAFTDGIAFLDSRQKLAFYPPGGTIDMRDFSESLAPVLLSRE